MDALHRSRPWASLLALAVLAAVVGACGMAATSPSVSTAPTQVPSVGPGDPAGALRIATPWVLDAQFPEIRQQILDGVLDDEGFKTAEVRHITGANGESAFLLAADAGLAADTDLEAFARRLSESTLTGGGVETIGDRQVVLLQTDEVSIVAWIEPPLLLAVYASDADTARRIAGAVLDATP